MIVVAFEDEREAERVLDTLKELDRKDIVDLQSAAVVVRGRRGKVEFRESRDLDVKRGAMAGALAGGVIGLLRRKMFKGALIGAAGGAIAGKVIDLGLKDDFLKEIGESLTPGSSAIVAMVDFEQVDQAMDVLDQFEGGRILRHTLSADEYRMLSEAVED